MSLSFGGAAVRASLNERSRKHMSKRSKAVEKGKFWISRLRLWSKHVWDMNCICRQNIQSVTVSVSLSLSLRYTAESRCHRSSRYRRLVSLTLTGKDTLGHSLWVGWILLGSLSRDGLTYQPLFNPLDRDCIWECFCSIQTRLYNG